MLYSLEVTNPIKGKHLRALETEDERYLRMLLKVESKCPLAGLYLGTGTLPICHEIRMKRLLYLHHILTLPKDKLIQKILVEQEADPVKNDWVITVKEDLLKFDIKEDFEDIAKMRKITFKKLVKIQYRQQLRSS